MESLKKYYDDFQVIDPSSSNTESSPEKDQKNLDNEDAYEDSSDNSFSFQPPPRNRKARATIGYKASDGPSNKSGGFFSGVRGFFSKGKKEQKEMKKLKEREPSPDTSTPKRLPKRFAEMVLDYELKIDSG